MLPLAAWGCYISRETAGASVARMNRFPCAVLLAAAACNNSHNANPDSFVPPIDAAPDAYVPGPNIVDFKVQGSPTVLQYRDGQGPWLTPTADTSGTYELHITNDYIAIAVCTSTGLAGDFDAEEFAATYADGPMQQIYCGNGATGVVQTTYAVTGTMVQAGSISIADSGSSTTAVDSAFDLTVPAGTYDLIALDKTHIDVDRGLSITADTALGTIDVDAAGAALVSKTLTLTGSVATDSFFTDVFLVTDRGAGFTTLYAGNSTTITTVPADLLQSGQDFLSMFAEDYAPDGTYRSVNAMWDDTTLTFALPATLSGAAVSVSGGVAVATWTALPANANDVSLALYGATQAQQSQTINASPSWLAATHATSLKFDTSAPSFSSEWVVDPTTGYYDFGVSSSDGTGAGISGGGAAVAQRHRVQHGHQVARARSRK